MRSEEVMLDLILAAAKNDERIRLVMLNGSRVDPLATRDKFCDFDIIYYVRDIQSFLQDDSWIEEIFGKILIMQKPDDSYSHPYDYEGNEPFTFLIQFQDGNRIDLTLIDLETIREDQADTLRDPGRILLQKEPIPGISDVDNFEIFAVQLPGEKEFLDTCNEFYWLATYVAKGVFRKELTYLKTIMEAIQYSELYKMLNWSVAIQSDFPIRTGKFSKYLNRFLDEADYQDLLHCFPGSDFEGILEKEINAIRLFDRHAAKVAAHFHFPYDQSMPGKIIAYLQSVQK
jgi:aminoglycoside 6-adenylyltransferase